MKKIALILASSAMLASSVAALAGNSSEMIYFKNHTAPNTALEYVIKGSPNGNFIPGSDTSTLYYLESPNGQYSLDYKSIKTGQIQHACSYVIQDGRLVDSTFYQWPGAVKCTLQQLNSKTDKNTIVLSN